MAEREVFITADVIARQRRAGSPGSSVWVEANAGAGKTHVLTQRVLRLLLAGAKPDNLLCLTYTKAAAAEMRKRVGDWLGQWATMPHDKLVEALTALEDRPPAAGELTLARTLFGHALETPGGLKINTIHAFCESVLQRFPLEAGVPFGFKVIEEGEQAELIRRAREAVFAEGLDGVGAVSDAVLTLFDMLSDSQIEDAIAASLAQGADLRKVLADPAAAKANLRHLLQLGPEDGIKALNQRAVSATLFPPARYADVFAICPPDPAKNRFEDNLDRIDRRNPTAEQLFKAFLNGDGSVPARFPKRDMMQAPGGLGELLVAEAERLAALAAKLKAARLLARSEALLDVLGAILDRYSARKRASSTLDFDDLIARMLDLLRDSTAREWVRYKLDAGITHILVDESQDTNPSQWALIETLVEEFFSGDGAARAQRTLFAVGDKKQSIYSFQGAMPQMFSEMGRQFGLRARQAEHPFSPIDLTTSFRTLPGILAAVDKVCDLPQVRAGLLIDDLHRKHDSARKDQGGRVTLWPPVRQEEIKLPDGQWPLFADRVELRSAPRQVAEHIAGTIKRWIDDARPLEQRGRAVTAADVLILVQSRGPLFHEIIRALKRLELPSPGADRLPVSTHIAVLDLLALADILLNPADDLNLAAVLRSPLFDVTDDELMALASGRDKNEGLWQALRGSQIASCASAYARLSDWRGRLDFERPYNFFAHLLYAEGGLRRFHARLGEEVDDVLAEFLDLALANEQSAQPALQGFLAAMRKSDITIKREFGEQGGGVRVMTVHGAKGLEAPIVILADATTAPNTAKMSKPVYLAPEKPGPLLIHASKADTHTAETSYWREADTANQMAEYWRKLYVAMTRAEDELYVTGALPKSKDGSGSWYEAISTALAAESIPLAMEGRTEDGLVFPASLLEPKPVGKQAGGLAALRSAFSAGPLPPPRSPEIIQPSSAAGSGFAFDTTAQSLVSAEQARKEGIALHALLQHLATVPRDLQHAVALKALGALLPGLPDRHAALVQKALSIFARPELEHVFGSSSRAEVPFTASATRDGRPVRIAGRIDRVVVTPYSVLVVDFKSDANPPAGPADIGESYLTQLGLYRVAMKKIFAQSAVTAAIFWTASESLMSLPDEALDRAIAGLIHIGSA